MFCPKCRYEFLEGVAHCDKCGAGLVDELVPLPPSRWAQWRGRLLQDTAHTWTQSWRAVRYAMRCPRVVALVAAAAAINVTGAAVNYRSTLKWVEGNPARGFVVRFAIVVWPDSRGYVPSPVSLKVNWLHALLERGKPRQFLNGWCSPHQDPTPPLPVSGAAFRYRPRSTVWALWLVGLLANSTLLTLFLKWVGASQTGIAGRNGRAEGTGARSFASVLLCLWCVDVLQRVLGGADWVLRLCLPALCLIPSAIVLRPAGMFSRLRAGLSIARRSLGGMATLYAVYWLAARSAFVAGALCYWLPSMPLGRLHGWEQALPPMGLLQWVWGDLLFGTLVPQALDFWLCVTLAAIVVADSASVMGGQSESEDDPAAGTL